MSEGIKSKENIATYIAKQFKNRNIFIFLFFLFVSAFLWFLMYVNKEHSTYIKIPYKFENLPPKAKISIETSEELTVQIHGHGYNLLREMAEQVKLPVVVDFENKDIPIVFHRLESNPNKSYILTDEIIPFLGKRFGNNIKVIGVNPDTLFFDFAETYSKKVKVFCNSTFVISNTYIQCDEITCTPDSVWLYGSKNIIDSINTVFCKANDNIEIGENHIAEAKLIPIKDISFSKSSVLVNVPVEKYTESNVVVRTKAVNYPDSLLIQLVPDNVQIFFKVPLSMYDKIDASNFEATADYSKRKNENINIEIKSNYPYIVITHHSPIITSFILERKKLK